MKQKKILTPAGLQKLEEELKQRIEERREELKDMIEELRDSGDLSENEGYQLALQERDSNEARIEELQDIIENAEIAEKCDTDGVCIGSIVTVKVGKTSRDLKIVGTEEADPADNQISHKSPIGQALLNKEIGSKVKVKTPGGEVEYEILKIEDSIK